MEHLRRSIDDLKARFWTLDNQLATLYTIHGKKGMLKNQRPRIIELVTEMKTIQGKLILLRSPVKSVCADIIEEL